ncbi:histidine phosphatase family protein [Acidisoma cellulosilytica]|uniref:Histidine phosphatase family protein n=1 Tax=Acidisoma cellulosilyticum TaxID=2802395 RepID=A0A963Z120_9PROT|nr:histidine phosphatase family protein [Acidisoma cellulosilyticum]MCB8879890.1 histidine phosphatase family protein [Acidisoma cellulosilyticum]
MSLRLTLIAHAASTATRQASFPLDEGLEPQGWQKAQALAGSLGRVDGAWTAPSLRTRQTAQVLGLVAQMEPALADIDLGAWAGRALAEVAAAEPEGLARWTADPAAAPHSGESVLDLLARVASWLAGLQGQDGRFVAITHAAVIRAVLISVLEADPKSFWRIDVEPLCFARLQAHAGRWTLRSLGWNAGEAA